MKTTSMPAKMVMVWASLACANNRIKEAIDFSPEVQISLMLELTVAVALAEAYDRIWDSIYWNNARESTKRNVYLSLTRIAFVIYGHLLAANELLAELPQANSQHRLEIKRHLCLATSEIKKVHSDKINSSQLHLWEKHN